MDELLSGEQIFDAIGAGTHTQRPDYEKIQAFDSAQLAAKDRIVSAYMGMFPNRSSFWAPPGWQLHNAYDNGARWTERRRELIAILTVSLRDERLWAHFSMSAKKRTPSYKEMCEAKDLFLGAERQAIALYPPRSKHVNIHPYALHLWCGLEGDGLPDFTGGTRSI